MVKTLRDMLIKHQHLLLCQHVSSNFLTFSKSNVEYYNLSEICNNILKKTLSKKADIWVKIILWKMIKLKVWKQVLKLKLKAIFKFLEKIDDLNISMVSKGLAIPPIKC